MVVSGTVAILSASFALGLYLFYRRISQMSKSGSCLFKVGYFLYTKTSMGHYYYRKEVDKAQRKYNNQPHTKTEATVFDGLSILPIPLSMDNYCYLVRDARSGTAILIDPADPQPVLSVLESLNVTPTAILTTHKHWDHSGGNSELRKHFRNVPVYGSKMDSVPSATHLLSDGDKVDFGELCFSVLHTPGHTIGHVVFVLNGLPFGAPDSLFSGDHLFLGGIGRMFEGTPSTMLASLDKVCQLADSTLVWPGHEYATDNLQFGLHIDPTNADVQQKLEWVTEQRSHRLCTSPSTLAEEKRYNPFLRCHTPNILAFLGLTDEPEGDERRAKALGMCRARKDKFKYTL